MGVFIVDKEVKKSVLNVLIDAIKVYVKIKTGVYAKNPVGAITDAKDAVEDVIDLKSDIKSALKDKETK